MWSDNEISFGHVRVKRNFVAGQIKPPVPNAPMDQVFATALQCTRGRVDRAFYVTGPSLLRMVGDYAGDDAWISLFEALNNGAEGAVVSRVVEAPQKFWATWWVGGEGTNRWITVDAVYGDQRDIDAAIVSPPPGVGGYGFEFAVLHHECFDDGIRLAFKTDENDEAFVTMLVMDKEGAVLFSFFGTRYFDPLNPTLDEMGRSYYLPDVVARETDLIEVIGAAPFSRGYPTHEDDDGWGEANWHTSPLMLCFTSNNDMDTWAAPEENYAAACERLRLSQTDFMYITPGKVMEWEDLLIFARLAEKTNAQLRYDLPPMGSGNDDQIDFAINKTYALFDAFGWANRSIYLIQAFWTPIETDDPSGRKGRGFYGTAALNIAYACRRNGYVNAAGFSTKNAPIAGRDWPLNRKNPRQAFHPTSAELTRLFWACINPVLHDQFTGGGRFVFRDAVAWPPEQLNIQGRSYKSISIAVVDMALSIDHTVARLAQDLMHLPLQIAQKRLTGFLASLFRAAEASGWLVPSQQPAMEGRSWKLEVKPHPERHHALQVNYWLSYEWALREIFVTHEFVRENRKPAPPDEEVPM